MTLRDKLEQRRAALFTDRELELNDMERLLATSPLAYNFLHISGVGGIGKSALVQAFARRCRVRGLPVALIDARAPRTAIEILAALQDQLRDWDAFTKFEQGLRKYLSIQGKLEKSSDVPEQIVQLAAKGITLVSQLHPLSHLAVQMVGPESVEAALELLHKVLTKDEIEFYLDAEDTLTQAFTSSLEKLTDRERMVLIFDSFERIGDLSAWLAGPAGLVLKSTCEGGGSITMA